MNNKQLPEHTLSSDEAYCITDGLLPVAYFRRKEHAEQVLALLNACDGIANPAAIPAMVEFVEWSTHLGTGRPDDACYCPVGDGRGGTKKCAPCRARAILADLQGGR